MGRRLFGSFERISAQIVFSKDLTADSLEVAAGLEHIAVPESGMALTARDPKSRADISSAAVCLVGELCVAAQSDSAVQQG